MQAVKVLAATLDEYNHNVVVHWRHLQQNYGSAFFLRILVMINAAMMDYLADPQT